MTTESYVAGSAYINRMSDYCKGCRFDPKTTCPLTPLYWAFLGRHRVAAAGRLLGVVQEHEEPAERNDSHAGNEATVSP